MATVTKKDLIERISDKIQLSRGDVKKTLQEFLEQVIIELRKGNRIEFRDFGVFEVKERAARVAQNPKTLERVHVPAKRTVKFKVGRLMREEIELGALKAASQTEVKPLSKNPAAPQA
ncbi:MAG: integration host factor subunit beta [Phycisphaerales bacterium]|jgi:integration host factor subunit beta|nr:integration host factor subunit beta [Phycisphaerales bacterium]NUQ68398.1 integration host factor subunit beta [Phycisphaerales bacterium]